MRGLHNETVLHFLAIENELDSVAAMAKNGIDVNCINKFGKSVLMEVVLLGYEKIARLLLEHGADPNLTDNEGNTPLHHACDCGAPESLIAVLEAFGADWNVKNDYGERPKDLAD